MKMVEAKEWVEKNKMPRRGHYVVSESAFDEIESEVLQEAVKSLIGDFEVPSMGEYAYAKVLDD